ncbi:MAG: hypothetical protein NXI32_29900, partial [bacterium]|nr:hypothetical protein [bacterium]
SSNECDGQQWTSAGRTVCCERLVLVGLNSLDGTPVEQNRDFDPKLACVQVTARQAGPTKSSFWLEKAQVVREVDELETLRGGFVHGPEKR